MAASSDNVRAQLVEALRLDLVGPDNNHPFAHELLPEPPSRWYLTGFLVPVDAPIEQRSDMTSDEEIDSGGDTEGLDDASPPDRAGARRSLLPSSMGLSVLVAPEVDTLLVLVKWGDYVFEGAEPSAEPLDDAPAPAEAIEEGTTTAGKPPADYDAGGSPAGKPKKGYRRDPREERLTIVLPAPGDALKHFPVPNSGGLSISVTSRAVADGGQRSSRLPKGTRSVSVFLVNSRAANLDRRYKTFVFQAELTVISPRPFIERPDLRGAIDEGVTDDWDERVADLQYRDVFEYAVGHGVSATPASALVSFALKQTWQYAYACSPFSMNADQVAQIPERP